MTHCIVIFGHLNPKRQQTIQKHLISHVMKAIMSDNSIPMDRFVTASSDEAIITTTAEQAQQDAAKVQQLLASALPSDFPPFKIQAFKLVMLESQSEKLFGFVKEIFYPSQQIEIKAAPHYLFAHAFKMYHKMPIVEADRKFTYEGMLCSIEEELL